MAVNTKAMLLHDAAIALLVVCRARAGTGTEPSKVQELATELASEHPKDPVLARIVALAADFATLAGQARWVAVAEEIERLSASTAR